MVRQNTFYLTSETTDYCRKKIRPSRYPALQIYTTVSVQRVTGFCQLISVIKIHPVPASLHGNTITYIVFFQGLVPFNSEKLKCGLSIRLQDQSLSQLCTRSWTCGHEVSTWLLLCTLCFVFSWPSLNFFPIETKILRGSSNKIHLKSPIALMLK